VKVITSYDVTIVSDETINQSKYHNDSRVVFVTGRGGAGFHSPDPALKRGRGGMFRVIPALPPSGAHPHSFPGRGPVRYHLFLTEARLGYGWGGGLRGDRGRECRKRHPAPGRSVGRGGEKGRGPAFFRAPSAP